MKFRYECINCNINQTLKIADLLGIAEDKKEQLVRDVLKMLATDDYTKTNPAIMASTWELICEASGNDNPYQALKKEYNNAQLEIAPKLVELIDTMEDKFKAYLYTAILGNIIDFGPGHDFETEDWLGKYKDELDHMTLGVDYSKELYEAIKQAKKIMYVGDNCGEIVLDKLFIEYLKTEFPDVNLTFVVRGKPVLNDITLDDAEQVGITEIVNVISDGGNSPGMVLPNTSKSFQKVFEEADLIIGKGQGNYEGLSEIKGKQIFLLLMAKCDIIAEDIGVEKMSKVCLRHGMR